MVYGEDEELKACGMKKGDGIWKRKKEMRWW